jgi:hypothetical protein
VAIVQKWKRKGRGVIQRGKFRRGGGKRGSESGSGMGKLGKKSELERKIGIASEGRGMKFGGCGHQW